MIKTEPFPFVSVRSAHSQCGTDRCPVQSPRGSKISPGIHERQAGISLTLPPVSSQHLLGMTRGGRRDRGHPPENPLVLLITFHSAASVHVSPIPHTWVPTAASGGSLGALWESSLWKLSLFIQVMMAETPGMHL